MKIQHGIEILNSPAVRMTNCLVMMGFLAVMGWASAARAATWRVDSSAPPGGDGRTWAGAFSRADAALASARLGDVVWFRAGTHPLDGVLRPPSGVTFHGGFAGTESSPAARTAINFAHETVLRQTKAGAAVVEIAGGRDVQLDGLTLTGAVGAPGLILRDCDETVAITWCRVTKNTAPVAGGGIRVIERSRPRVFNVQISENRATGDEGGGGPVFILGGRGAIEALNTLHRFPVELMAKPHRNHHTSWALRDTPERARVRAWLTEILARPAR